jgi:hypothetical protein
LYSALEENMKLSNILALVCAFSISCGASQANPPQFSGHNTPVVNGAVNLGNFGNPLLFSSYSTGYNSGGYNLVNFMGQVDGAPGINLPALGFPTFSVPNFQRVAFQVLSPINPDPLFLVVAQTANDGFFHISSCSSTFVPNNSAGHQPAPNEWVTQTTGGFFPSLPSHPTISSVVVLFLGATDSTPVLQRAHVFGVRVLSSYGPSSLYTFRYLTGAEDPFFRFE